jgi:hypothetical protein
MQIRYTEGFKQSMKELCSPNPYYVVRRFVLDIPYQLRRIKWFFQRGRRGWAHNDTWDLDSYLCSWMPDALRHLAEGVHGCPAELYDKEDDDACHRWREILIQMADGFEAARRVVEDQNYTEVDGEYDLEISCAKDDADREKFKAAIALFEKYFFNLWD